MGGRSQPRPRRPDRHRRSGGRGATAGTPATCGIGVVHAGTWPPCTSTPKFHVHSRIGIGTGLRRSKRVSRKPGRTRHRGAVDHRAKGAARKRQPEQCGHGPPSHPPSRNRRCGPARAPRMENAILGMDDVAVEETGGFQACLPPDRRDEGTAPIGPPRRNDRRPFGMAFKLLRRRRDLTARGDGPLPIRKRTPTSGSTCTGSALGCDTPPMPQVAVVVAFVRHPEARLCRAGLGGRDRSDPPPWTLGVPRGRVGMCTPSQPSAGGRSGSSGPLREGETASRDGSPLDRRWRCRTAHRPAGRPTGPPPPRSGARHPSGRTAGWERPRSGRGEWGCPAPSSPVPIEVRRNGGSLPATHKECGSAPPLHCP